MMAPILIIIVVSIYLALCLYIGYRAMKATLPSPEEFFVAGRRIGSFVTATATLGAYFSAFSFLGAAGYSYLYGYSHILWTMIMINLLVPLAVVIARKMRRLGKELGLLTPADFFCERYGSPLIHKILVGVIGVIFATYFYMTIQIIGSGYAFEVMTGGIVPYAMGVAVASAIVAIYVFMGGQRGVAWTDALQALIMITALVFLGAYAFYATGGALFDRLKEVRPVMLTSVWPPIFSVTLGLACAFGYAVYPLYWMRAYSARDDRAIWHSGWFGLGIGNFICVAIIIWLIAAGAAVFYPNIPATDADKILLYFSRDFLHPLVGGFIVAGLLSASMSTIDIMLLTVGAVISHDLLEISSRIRAMSEKRKTWISRFILIILIILVYVFSLSPPGLLITIVVSTAIPIYAAMLPGVVFGLWWRRGNTYGSISSLVVGFATAIYTGFISPNPLRIHAGVWSTSLATLAYVVVSLLTPPPSEEILRKFKLSPKTK
jgi:SSS family transporter